MGMKTRSGDLGVMRRHQESMVEGQCEGCIPSGRGHAASIVVTLEVFCFSINSLCAVVFPLFFPFFDQHRHSTIIGPWPIV